MFTQADKDFLKSMKILETSDPIPEEVPEPEKPMNRGESKEVAAGPRKVKVMDKEQVAPELPEEKLVAQILQKILKAPGSVPVDALEELGEQRIIHNVLHGLNDYGLIFWSKKKQGFFTNPMLRPVVEDIIQRNGL